MANFKPTVISKEFITAVNDAQTSAKVIKFDSVVASQTVLTDDATNNLTYATAQQCSQDVAGTVNAYRNQDPNTLIIDSNVNNKSLSNDVKVATLLIYGQYDGKKILIATARLATNDLLPKFDGSPVTLEYELYLSIQGASNVTINVNESGLATRKDVADLDSRSVHNTGNETVNGVKTFIQKIIGNITNADRATTAGTADQLKNGNQSINGNLTVPVDNSMINVGNDADLALVKKLGQGGTLVVGNGKTFKLQKSSSTKISPTDTLTDLLTVDQSGNVVANSFTGKIKSKFLNSNSDLYNLIEPGFTYFVPTTANANTILNKPTEVATAFSVTTVDVAGYTPNSYASTQLFLIEHYSGKMFTATLSANATGDIKVNQPWTKIPTDDSKILHKTGNETVDDVKTFNKPIVGSLKGNSDTSAKLVNARNIGGVSFDGTKDIDLPGVNIKGNQDTTGTSSATLRTQVQKLPAGSTIDDVKKSGVYMDTDGDLHGLPFYPIWGVLEVFERGDSDVVQRFNITAGADDADDFRICQRSFASGRWKSWKEI